MPIEYLFSSRRVPTRLEGVLDENDPSVHSADDDGICLAPHRGHVVMPDWLVLPEWRDLIDIAVVAGFAWLAIRSFRRTRARAALTGLAFVGVVYVLAQRLDLQMTATLLQAFFAVAVLVLVVIFQEDLRRVFEQIGSWRQNRPVPPAESRMLDILARTAARLAAEKSGALIVLPGDQPLDRHIEGGIPLRGQLSEPLLLSLFDKNSPGHDGAVLLRGSTVDRFAVHLPLSTQHAALGSGGTRHAAALGLAERCDAVCIVVSEERGTISIARDGALRTLASPNDLTRELRAFVDSERPKATWWQGRAGLDAAVATIGAVVLWFILVPGSNLSERTVEAEIEFTNLPKGTYIESAEPETAEVTLRGLRRDLMLADRDKVTIQIDAYLARMGRRTFAIDIEDVQKRNNLSVLSVHPDTVRLSLATQVEPEGPKQP